MFYNLTAKDILESTEYTKGTSYLIMAEIFSPRKENFSSLSKTSYEF